ncbi:MAG: hypothetical protein KF767_07835 [Bdellovibrionaceae bacterium]|nr:hypothetical protein [Pseudobdellovibrionaceae bacterium]
MAKFGWFLGAAFLMWGGLAIAGESGVIYQGKRYPLFKDGQKAGELPTDILAAEKSGRKPSAEPRNAYASPVYYTSEDNGITCFIMGNGAGGSNISCVK